MNRQGIFQVAEKDDDIKENEIQDYRVLNQEEIDALLGYGYSDEEETHQKNGLHAILKNNMVFLGVYE